MEHVRHRKVCFFLENKFVPDKEGSPGTSGTAEEWWRLGVHSAGGLAVWRRRQGRAQAKPASPEWARGWLLAEPGSCVSGETVLAGSGVGVLPLDRRRWGLFVLEGSTGGGCFQLRPRSHECLSLEVCQGSWTAPAGPHLLPHGGTWVPNEVWPRWFLELPPSLRGCCRDGDARSEFSRLCSEGCG